MMLLCGKQKSETRQECAKETKSRPTEGEEESKTRANALNLIKYIIPSGYSRQGKKEKKNVTNI